MKMVLNATENVVFNMSSINASNIQSDNSTAAIDDNCDEYHLFISRVIAVVSILAVVGNTILAISIAKLKENKNCRMFWFLWHLSIADALLAIPFVVYHCRRLISCPFIYQ